MLSALKRVDVFKQLKNEDFKTLTEDIYYWDVKQGTLIFSQSEPCDELYIVATGRVELLDPEEHITSLFLGKNDDLGWLAFITGTPYRFTARAAENTSLWVLPRTTFFELLATSPKLTEALQHWLKSTKVKKYLQQHHYLSATKINEWCKSSAQQIAQHGFYHSPVQIEHNREAFKKVAHHINAFDLLANLPENELNTIADHLVYKKYAKGNTFFHEGEAADHIFLIDTGSVSVIDAFNRFSHSIDLTPHNDFGNNAFMTGGRYTMSAMALEPTAVWVLRKKEFNYLIMILPELAKRYKTHLQQQEIRHYLIHRQKLSEENAALWIKSALKKLTQGAEINPVISYRYP